MSYSNLSFHTFEVHKREEYKTFQTYKDILYEYCNKNNKKIYSLDKERANLEIFCEITFDDPNISFMSKEVTICEALREKGIIIELIQCVEVSCYNTIPLYNGIWLRINPRRVINNNDYIGIFDMRDTEIMLSLIDKYIKGIDPCLPSVDQFILGRIDLCKNIVIGNQRLVENYVDLSKRCMIPKGYYMNMFYDEKNRSCRLSKNGIKISNKSSSFVLYNKKAQMDSENSFFADAKLAEGLLRLEIQKSRQSVNYLGKKKGIKEVKNFIKNGDKFALAEFNRVIPRIFCRGDYVPYKIACKEIEKSIYSKKTKKHMLELLESTSIHRNLNKGIYELKRLNYSGEQINNTIKKFDEININPVTIPRGWGIKVLPNLAKLITSNIVIIL